MKPSIKSLLISRQSPAGVIRFDCLHQIDVIEMALRANRFGGHAELVAERSGESFVGAIAEIQSDGQDIIATVASMRAASVNRRPRMYRIADWPVAFANTWARW